MQTISRMVTAAAFGMALAAGSAGIAAASDATAGALAKAKSQAYPGETFSQYYRRGYYGRGYGGGAVAAGVLGGLALGALAAGAAASAGPGPTYPGAPVGNVYGHDPSWVDYCARRYRSFDPASGTYLARDGLRYPCE